MFAQCSNLPVGTIRLTYHAPGIDSDPDRPAHEGGAIQAAPTAFEITPEMIEAGVDAALGHIGGAELGGMFSISDLVSEVFLAMERARTK